MSDTEKTPHPLPRILSVLGTLLSLLATLFSQQFASTLSLSVQSFQILFIVVLLIFVVWSAYEWRKWQKYKRHVKSPGPPSAPPLDPKFLIEKRHEHYIRLSENIFKPLASYRLQPFHPADSNQWNRLKAVYDISQIRSSSYFEDAKKHLEKSLPSFLKEIETLEESVQRLCQNVDGNRSLARKKIELDLEGIAPIAYEYRMLSQSREEMVLLPNVLTIIESYWFNIILNRYWEGQTLDAMLPRLHKVIEDYEPEWEESGILKLGSIAVARFFAILAKTPLPESWEKMRNLSRAIDQLVRNNELLALITQLAESRKSLSNKADNLSRKAAQVVHLVEDERYSDVCECCPTATSLLRAC